MNLRIVLEYKVSNDTFQVVSISDFSFNARDIDFDLTRTIGVVITF